MIMAILYDAYNSFTTLMELTNQVAGFLSQCEVMVDRLLLTCARVRLEVLV